MRLTGDLLQVFKVLSDYKNTDRNIFIYLRKIDGVDNDK